MEGGNAVFGGWKRGEWGLEMGRMGAVLGDSGVGARAKPVESKNFKIVGSTRRVRSFGPIGAQKGAKWGK